MAEQKKTISVTLEVRELMYDIKNKSYLTGQAREAGGKSYQEASNMQASDDDENAYQLRRSLVNAFSGLKSLLGEYLHEDKTTTNNRVYSEVDENGQLQLSFKMPSNYNNASVDSLGNGIHAYLVSTALAEWFIITNREDVEGYLGRSRVDLEVVKRALYKRSRPSRPAYE